MKTRVLRSGLSLARLRAGFLLLGALLLGCLGFLSQVVRERLDEARRDREEMVALRVFDELEREVSAFLESENERPSYVDLEDTDPKSWAPFVVGYFKRGELITEQVPAEGMTSENSRRLKWALEQASDDISANDLESRGGAAPEPSRASDGAQRKLPDRAPSKVAAPPIEQKKVATGSELIDSLNRAPERRKLLKPRPDDEGSPKNDQFSDYQEQY